MVLMVILLHRGKEREQNGTVSEMPATASSAGLAVHVVPYPVLLMALLMQQQEQQKPCLICRIKQLGQKGDKVILRSWPRSDKSESTYT